MRKQKEYIKTTESGLHIALNGLYLWIKRESIEQYWFSEEATIIEFNDGSKLRIGLNNTSYSTDQVLVNFQYKLTRKQFESINSWI